MIRFLFFLSIVMMVGCQSGDEEPTVDGHVGSSLPENDPSTFNDSSGSEPSDVSSPSFVEFPAGGLRPHQLLARLSLDLRGRRPTIQEMEQIDADPSRLNEFLDAFLRDAAFQNRVADDVSRAFRNRYEAYPAPGVEESFEEQYQNSAAQETTRLVRHIVMNDLPFSDVLTADYTFANEALAQAFALDGYDINRGGWQRVAYDDGRPGAGVLSYNSFYLRYLTDGINFNRGRANAVSRIFLCDDYLKRPVDFPRNINLNDETGVSNAVRENPACIACHATLDPLASYFTPFTLIEDSPVYDHDAVDAWEEMTQVPPSFGGESGDTVADLGRQLVADPRFARCIVRRTYESLLDREATAADVQAITTHTERFIDSGMRLKVLYKSVVMDPVYRGLTDGDRPALEEKMMSPEILGDSIEVLTGFRWEAEGSDLLRNEGIGFRVLGGGVSSLSGEYPARTANVSRVLVQNRIAESAALYLLYDAPRERDALFGDIDFHEQRPSIESLSRLGQRLWSRPVSRDEAVGFIHLFDDLVTDGMEPTSAWAASLSLFLRDPSFLLY